MAKTIPVPCLSPAGWVRSPSEKADALIAHFYESDKAQTHLYGDQVSNLQYLIERYGHDIISLQQQLRAALEIYLGRYYQVVTVRVSNDDTPAKTDGKIEMRVYADVTEDGHQYSFGKLLQISNSKIERVSNLNTYGTTAPFASL